MTESYQNPSEPLKFAHDTIPEEGYELGPDESVELSLDLPRGIEFGERVVGRLRIGGHTDYTELDIVSMRGASRWGNNLPSLSRTLPDGQKRRVDLIDQPLLVGRMNPNPAFADMPDTVSGAHVWLNHRNPSGLLEISNQDPTNKTILLPALPVDNPTQEPKREATPPPVTPPLVESSFELYPPSEPDEEEASEAVIAEGSILPSFGNEDQVGYVTGILEDEQGNKRPQIKLMTREAADARVGAAKKRAYGNIVISLASFDSYPAANSGRRSSQVAYTQPPRARERPLPYS